MHYLFALLASLVSLISATPLKGIGLDFSYVPFPGPIPYSDISNGGEWPRGTTRRYNGGLSTDDATMDTMRQCLLEYGSGRFYDSWDGNRCGGMGWFKGTTNDKVNPYACYQTCAPYLMFDGAKRGAGEYLCDYRTGLKGHCWMGYHPLPAVELEETTAPEVASS